MCGLRNGVDLTLATSKLDRQVGRWLDRYLIKPLQAHHFSVVYRILRAGNPAVIALAAESELPGQAPAAMAWPEFAWRDVLASALATLIEEQLEPILLRNIVRSQYAACHPYDQQRILMAACLRSHANRPQVRVASHLEQYLADHRIVHLEGFVHFRMPHYLALLEECVEQAADELLFEREYQAFVHTLHDYVAKQHPRLQLCHVVFDREGGFRALDENGRRLACDLLDERIRTPAHGNVTQEALLISALVTISPRKVLLHDPHQRCPQGALPVLRTIFPHSVHLCSGCRRCVQEIDRR